MSKFIDKLNQLSRSEGHSIGFTQRVAASTKARIQLVASLAMESAESLIGYLDGADAGLITISKATAGAEALQKVSEALPDIPWGGRLSGISPSGVKQLTKASGDFLVFSATDTPLTLIENDKTGKILAVEASLSEGLLRATNELPLDAVLIAGEEKQRQALTWQHLILFRRFADLLARPLLVSVPSQVTAGELKALWEAGVRGVVMEVNGKQPEGSLKKLRQEIDKLDFSSPHRSGREVSLPRTGRETSPATTEEEED
ncbi:hypothetical protein ACFLVC_04150 [Chloroflexota bacterium]